jgi:hypothetical protein
MNNTLNHGSRRRSWPVVWATWAVALLACARFPWPQAVEQMEAKDRQALDQNYRVREH